MGRWHEVFVKAKELGAQKRYAEAIPFLERAIADIEREAGEDSDFALPKFWGLLGLSHFHEGEYQEALGATTRALTGCQDQEDLDGIVAYYGNLAEIHRQLGNTAEFERYREKRAETLQKVSGEAPPDPDGREIIFRDDEGRELTREELENFSGKATWQVVGVGTVPHKAGRLHEAGREAGQAEDFKRALALFDEAARVAPAWPYPLYDAAFTYLMLKDFDRALEYYERVDAMEPGGFFMVKTAVHTLRRERRGELPSGTYLLYISIEWQRDRDAVFEIIDALLSKSPDFAPAWKHKAALSQTDLDRRESIDRGLSCDSDVDTRGWLLLYRAELEREQGHKEKAIETLSKLVLDENGSNATRLLARKILVDLVAE